MQSSNAKRTAGCITFFTVSTASCRGTHLNDVICFITLSLNCPKYLGTSGFVGHTMRHCAHASVGSCGVGAPVNAHIRRGVCLLQIVLSVFQRSVLAFLNMAISSTTIKSMSGRSFKSSTIVLSPSVLMMYM